MAVIGWIAVVIVALAVLALIVTVLVSMPDISRYRRIRHM